MTAMGGAIARTRVIGPLGEAVDARFGLSDDGLTGIVELAEASGLALVPEARRDPTRSTTYGTGQLIAAAAARGCRRVIVCIGGSATVDGGAGIAQALGGRFTDRQGRPIEAPMCGGRLAEIAAYAPPPNVPEIQVACDVTNPLLGARGAAAVYGPQKGATPAQVRQLEASLGHLASLVPADPDVSGAGAAGGAGWGLSALLGATLRPGIDLVLEVIGFRRRCAGAGLVLTGEGRLDSQSLHGKATVGVARAAAEVGVPTIAIVGQDAHGDDKRIEALFSRIISLSERYGTARSLSEPEPLLAEASQDATRDELNRSSGS